MEHNSRINRKKSQGRGWCYNERRTGKKVESMRWLTFEAPLKQYVVELSGVQTESIHKPADCLDENPYLKKLLDSNLREKIEMHGFDNL